MRNVFFAGILATAMCAGSAYADVIEIVCKEDDGTRNYVTVPDTQVQSCIEAGEGNIGNGQNDDFLNSAAGAGWADVGDGTFSQSLSTWSFDSALWGSYGELALGLKFGTGNTADEWFVLLLQNGVSSGTFTFYPCDDGTQSKDCTGGGISHVSIYGRGTPEFDVPEPGTLALLGLGLAGLGFGARRRKA